MTGQTGDAGGSKLDTSAQHDRRRHVRVPINQEFECIDEYVSEYVSDISQGGVFIRSKTPLPVGTTVTLQFSVIVEDFQTIRGEGEVVRVDMSEDHMGMGIAFTKLTAESKDLIDRIVRLYKEGEL